MKPAKPAKHACMQSSQPRYASRNKSHFAPPTPVQVLSQHAKALAQAGHGQLGLAGGGGLGTLRVRLELLRD